MALASSTAGPSPTRFTKQDIEKPGEIKNNLGLKNRVDSLKNDKHVSDITFFSLPAGRSLDVDLSGDKDGSWREAGCWRTLAACLTQGQAIVLMGIPWKSRSLS